MGGVPVYWWPRCQLKAGSGYTEGTENPQRVAEEKCV